MLVKVKTENKALLINTDYITHVYEYHLDYKDESGISIWIDGSAETIMVPGMTLDEFAELCNIYSVPGKMVTALIDKMDKMEGVIMGGFQHVGDKLNYIAAKR